MAKKIQKLNKQTESKWWKLDNAGLIFPAVASASVPKVFRISAYLTKNVNIDALQEAVGITLKRYPQFNVRFKKGFFWSYFEELEHFPIVKEEENYPCKAFNLSKNRHLIRILYYKKKISFECFHGLADGGGAFKFFETLLKAYFYCLTKGKISFPELFDLPSPEESEDAFARYADLKSFAKRDKESAYQIKGTPLKTNQTNLDILQYDADKLKEVAKAHGATITEFLMANLMLAIEKQRKFYGSKKKVKILLPFDLRRRMPSKTLKNFVVSKIVKLEGENFAEIVQNIKTEMSKVDQRFCLDYMNTNVRDQRLFFVKLIPNVIKKAIMKLCYYMFGENTGTLTFSNFGKISLPEEIAPYVVDFDLAISREAINTYFAGCLTYNGKLNMCFSSKVVEKEIIRNFALNLKEFGLEGVLRSNLK